MSILEPDPAEMIKQNLNKFFTDPTNLNNPKQYILVPYLFIIFFMKSNSVSILYFSNVTTVQFYKSTGKKNSMVIGHSPALIETTYAKLHFNF